MTEEKRTLIETFLPVDEISEEAKKEKNGRAPTFEMHYWWTRKPLITARAAVLGALLPADFDPQEFKKLLGLEYVNSTGKRAHNYDIPLERIEQLKKEYKKVWGDVPTVLDPFAGGGSIPFEAMRVGVDAIANDYNPVAHLIEKATLEYPRKYGDEFSKDVKKGLEWIFNETKREMEQYYPKHEDKDVVAYIWAWSVKCPKCGFDAPLVGQWDLAKTDKKKITLFPSFEGSQLKLEIKQGSSTVEGTCSGGKGRCLKCGSSISPNVLKNEISTKETEILLAKVVAGKKGKEYYLPTSVDIAAIEQSKKEFDNNLTTFIKSNLIAMEEMPDDNRGSMWAKVYLKYWNHLLNPRQKLLFVILVKNIQRYLDSIGKTVEEDYKKAINVGLSLIFGKFIDYNCRSTSWHRTREIVAHALTTRSIGMRWDHMEVNPFIKGSGSLHSINDSIIDGINYAKDKLQKRGSIELHSVSISQIDKKVKIIATDPPYYDDVQYAELSEFFYVWEQKALKNTNFPGTVPKSEDMSIGGQRDEAIFKRLFQITSKKFYELIDSDGILVMFFAHSSIDAWDFVVNSLQKSGLRITATWPIHTENLNNPIAKGNASIMSSIIIVARKRKSNKSGYIEEIQEDIREHLMKRLDEFWKYGLRGADLTVSAMGATLDILTQYSEIKSYTGEMQIKDVLELVQKYVAEYVLNRYMKNASGLDAATSFYLYTRLSQLEGMPFDTANLIAKSMNVDLKLFEKQGLIETSKKGKAQGIKILNFSLRETNSKQSLIDCVQFVMTTFAKGGYTEVERELATIPFSRNEIKDVLEALLSLPTEDPERQVAQKILERMGQSFPKQGQTGLDNF
jgi:adenine-specific DNA methylase